MNYNDNGFKIFLSYIFRQKKLFIIDMVCAISASLIDLLFPAISRYSMYTLLPGKMFSAFFVLMGVMIVAYFLRAGFYYVILTVGHNMGVLVEADMREDIFNHIQRQSFSYFDKNRTGALMSRITSDLFEITELSHHGPEDVVICTFTIIGSLIIMFTMNWELALTLACVLPVCMGFTISQRKRMRSANLEVKKKTAEINAAIESGISGIRTAKAFANENTEKEKFTGINAIFKTAKKDFYKAMGLFQSGMEFTIGIMQVVVITVGGILIMQDKMSYVDLITFTLYVSAFTGPVRKLAAFSEQYMAGSAGFRRFLEVMRTEPDIQDDPDAEELKDVTGAISYKNVSFSYKEGVPVLTNISLDIKPGECYAVVGSSGGGKTTLCQLLPRFYEVNEGEITIDGKNIQKLTQFSLHKNIGIIQQDVFMFAGTVRENIEYGRPGASLEEIIEAAKLAEIHDEIMEMPDGYDTYIGERGVMLSGGQKQRISISRVFLKNPKILILDEATSALDTVTEQKIQASLDRLSEGRTTLIIAHRLSTIKNADKIAVIEGESIVECGSHKELMQKDGVYAALVRAQSLATES